MLNEWLVKQGYEVYSDAANIWHATYSGSPMLIFSLQLCTETARWKGRVYRRQFDSGKQIYDAQLIFVCPPERTCSEVHVHLTNYANNARCALSQLALLTEDLTPETEHGGYDVI